MKIFEIHNSTGKGKTALVLTERHLEILKEKRENRINGKSQTYSWYEIKHSLKNKKNINFPDALSAL